MSIVINIFGGPGVGKSTLASKVFFELKTRSINVELASEWIKNKIFEGTDYPIHDQLYTFAKQNKLLRQLNHKVDYIITDSPLPLSIVYQKDEPKSFNNLVLEYFNLYDNKNYLVNRDHEYKREGRYQTEEEADIVHRSIKKMLDSNHIPYKECDASKSFFTIFNDLIL